MTGKRSDYRRLRIAFWCAAIVLEAVYVWVSRNAMNPDGVSYLDMGDAFFHHHWHMAINAYWSPLYPWIEGFFLWLLKPSANREYLVVHLVNFFIYIGALASFEFFLRSFLVFHRKREPEGNRGLPEWAWYVLGYGLFIWTALIMVGGVRNVSPDLCVEAVFLLASGMLLRMRSRTATWGTFVLFGVVLGGGYLVKAVMFPLAFVFLVVALFSLGSLRKAVPRVVIATLVFAAIASPWLVLLSRAQGHLTFGETGRVNYENRIDGYPLWFPVSPALKHPIPELVDNPPTYEFAKPVGGTYPMWYDTSYWHQGLTPRFNAKGEAKATAKSIVYYGHLVLSPRMQLFLVVGWLVLLWLGRRLDLKTIGSNWPVIIPALAAIGGYLLIYTEMRYVAADFLILWMVLYSGVRFPLSQPSRRRAAAVVVAIGLLFFYRPIYALAVERFPAYWQAADALHEDGVKPGDKIAVIGFETAGMYVARLAKTQIIAEVREAASSFGSEEPATRARVIQVLRETGAKAILASWKSPSGKRNRRGRAGNGILPASATSAQSDWHAGWQKLGNTRYYMYVLAGTGPHTPSSERDAAPKR